MLERMRDAWAMLTNSGFLSSNRIRSFFLYTKEPLEELMFGSMLKRQWFVALGASPIYLVMMPMFSLILIGLALVDIVDLARAKEKNLDLWLNAIVGSTCATLATTSIVLLEITLITGTPFAFGPWFFLASVSVFSCNAFFQSGLNLYRALQSPPNTQQRLDYFQSSINWAFIFSAIFSVVGCCIFVIISPTLCAPAGTACAASVVTLTTASLAWRMTPSRIKSWLKQSVGLEMTGQAKDDESSVSTVNTTCDKMPVETIEHCPPNDEILNWTYSSRHGLPLSVSSPDFPSLQTSF